METKACIRCHLVLGIESFSLDKRGRRNVCKECRRKSSKIVNKLRREWRKNNPDTVATTCDCCGERRKLVVDHCHDTGEMRGWLCNPCNVAIGNLGDNLSGVLKAVQYLSRSK